MRGAFGSLYALGWVLLGGGCIHGVDRPQGDGGLQEDGGPRSGWDELDLATHTADRTIDVGMDALPGPVALCDLNGDGHQDLAVALPNAPGPFVAAQPAFGRVVVLSGPKFGQRDDTSASVELDRAQPLLWVYGAAAGDHLGQSLACADLDADDHDDLLIGAPRAEGGRGHVYVVRGQPVPARVLELSDGDAADALVRGAHASDALGASVSTAFGTAAHDLPILLLGAPGFDGLDGQRDAAGAVYALLAPSMLLADQTLQREPDAASALWVGAQAGDKLGTLVLGVHAQGATKPGSIATVAPGVSRSDCQDCGALRVLPTALLTGGQTIDDRSAPLQGHRIDGSHVADGFGASVGVADVVGGDGLADWVVGAPNWGRRGRVYVFDGASVAAKGGSSVSIADEAFRIALEGRLDSQFGAHLAVATATSGDAHAAAVGLFVGAPSERDTRGTLRRLGIRSGYAPQQQINVDDATEIELTMVGSGAGDHLGSHLASGQLNRDSDGRVDVVTVDRSGLVHIVFGRAR